MENLVKDIQDATKIGTHTTESASSSVVETTAFPADLTSNNQGISNKINKHSNAIDELSQAISGRNIKSSELENPQDMKELTESSGIASLGGALTASGSGAKVASIASALDQSAHYPDPIFNKSIYESIINNSPESVAKSTENITDSAYHFLYDKHGYGNESASADSSVVSSMACGSDVVGSEILKNGKNAFEKTEKKIPS